jgi:hypothetical protein
MEYKFTREQLGNLLAGVVDMFIEYRDKHGRTEEEAKFAAIGEMFEGLDTEFEPEQMSEGVRWSNDDN